MRYICYQSTTIGNKGHTLILKVTMISIQPSSCHPLCPFCILDPFKGELAHLRDGMELWLQVLSYIGAWKQLVMQSMLSYVYGLALK